MRVNVISALGSSAVAATLIELGCAVRELTVGAPAAEVSTGADAALIDAGDDGELARFVVARVRSSGSRIPVLLILSASQLARVDPSWGHDDFLVTPCTPSELYARLRSAEWRASEFSQPERIKIGALVLDPGAHEATAHGIRLDLTQREFALLVHLAKGRGRVMPRDQLLAQVFGIRRGAQSRTLDVHVRTLRVKLQSAVQIETLRGVGYKLVGP